MPMHMEYRWRLSCCNNTLTSQEMVTSQPSEFEVSRLRSTGPHRTHGAGLLALLHSRSGKWCIQ